MDGVKPTDIYKQMAGLAHLARVAYAPYKRQILALTGLGFVSGILEGVGINAVIPLLSSVLGLHDAATDTLSKFIQNIFAWLHIPFFAALHACVYCRAFYYKSSR